MIYYFVESKYPNDDKYTVHHTKKMGATELGGSSTSATIGKVCKIYSNGSSVSNLYGPEYPRAIDKLNYIEVVFSKDLPAISRDSSFNNYFLIGEELVIITCITNISNKRYKLSGIYRDRFGYPDAAYKSHLSLGEKVVYIDSAVGKLNIQKNEQVLLHAQSSKTSQNKSNRVLLVASGVYEKCLPPANVSATKSGNDLVVTFNRRDRSGVNWSTSGEVTLSETQEKYGLNIYDSNLTLLRTINVSDTSSITYTEAQQISDFGSVQDDFYIKVFQYNSSDIEGFETQYNYQTNQTYSNDFSSETPSTQLSNSTKVWTTTNATYNVTSDYTVIAESTSSGNKALSLDDKLLVRNAEIFLKFKIADTGGFCVIFRGKNDVSGLVFNINSALTSIKYSNYTAGVEGSAIVSSSKTIDTNVWYYLRLKCIETLVLAKVWKSHLYEPSSYDLVGYNSEDAGVGWIGIGQNVANSDTELEFLKVKVL